jgi:hypothetical protein
MNTVFADTFYWIAFTNAQDTAHEKAREFTLSAKPGASHTTEEVLTEYLNYFAGWGSRFRRYAATRGVALILDIDSQAARTALRSGRSISSIAGSSRTFCHRLFDFFRIIHPFPATEARYRPLQSRQMFGHRPSLP